MTQPDLILTNARIRTMDPDTPFAEAIAVAGGVIVAVGTAAEVDSLAGPDTRTHDLGGRAVIPGLIDSHTHGLWGATRDLVEVFTGLASGHDEMLAAVAARVPQTKPGHWIIAGPWKTHMRPEMGSRPADIIDRIAPETPVAIKDITQHSLWLNSAAMRDAGIDASTADIPGGEIERDAQGNPTGILRENAMSLVATQILPPPSERARAVQHMIKTFNSHGITAFKEPMAFEAELEGYAEAEDAGTLTVHVAAHLTRQSPVDASMTPIETLQDWRKRYARPHISTDFAKLFLDGVAPSRTAAFVGAYLGADPAAHDPQAMLILKPDVVAAEVTALDAAGFTVKMHAVGDRAVQAGLDGIEAARKANGPSGLRHELAHCPYIRDQDIARFAELDAVAEVSPKIWFPNPVTAGQQAALGEERADLCHRIGDLLRAGAEVSYGSDWPAAAPDANPWTGLAGMISRRDPTGRFPGTVGADQAITLEQALTIFTVNGARTMNLQDRIGRLKPGFSADMVVLERPLEDMTPEEIGAITPDATLFEGRVVHGALS
ncbi:amidohydrolase [Paracoccus sp. (in: a-proteobacteria)]|uniref:amidohydrolase n=1 Tax=Paracoccus sp. TaxID=267 RepID=UPI003A8C5F7B